jgi:uncharacterized protein (TIGR00369 family)
MQERPDSGRLNDDEHPGADRKANSSNQTMSGASVSGLDHLRAVKSGVVQHPPIAGLIGCSIQEVEEGSVVFEFSPSEQYYNDFGTVHGGLAAAVIDAATGCAVYSTLAAGAGFATINLNVQYVRPITADVGKMRCEGRIIQVGNRIGTAEAKLVDQQGRIYAFGSSSCMILR